MKKMIMIKIMKKNIINDNDKEDKEIKSENN